MDNTKIGKERKKFLLDKCWDLRWNADINTQKLNWNVLTITDFFLDQKRVNVCEYTWCHLYCAFTQFYSLLFEKRSLWVSKVSVKFLCVYLCFSCGYLFIFFFRWEFPLFIHIFQFSFYFFVLNKSIDRHTVRQIFSKN